MGTVKTQCAAGRLFPSILAISATLAATAFGCVVDGPREVRPGESVVFRVRPTYPPEGRQGAVGEPAKLRWFPKAGGIRFIADFLPYERVENVVAPTGKDVAFVRSYRLVDALANAERRAVLANPGTLVEQFQVTGGRGTETCEVRFQVKLQ